MAEPTINRIVQQIADRLRPVVPDRNGGVGRVAIVRPGRPITEDDTIVVQQRGTKPLPTLDCPGNPPAVAFEATIEIKYHVSTQTESEDEFATACNKAVSEVVKAITQDATWYSFDGLAINAKIGTMRELPTDHNSSISGITIPILVQYRVSENDHTQAR